MPCRYIVHSDDHNPYLASMEDFASKLEDFEPDLLVVGGLQMMDNFPFQAGERKLVVTFRRASVILQRALLVFSHEPVDETFPIYHFR